MREWRQSTWGDEISLEYGKSLRDYAGFNGRVRVYGSNGPIGYTDKALSEGPGVILGRKGAYRGVEYSKMPFFVIDTAYYVSPKTDLDMRWIYYAVKYHKLGEIDDGSPIPSTTRAAVYVRDLEVPSPEEQKAISSVLAALDDKIELNRQMNATLEAMARALFKSWFVDFDPVRAKIEGKQPFGMDAATAALFPSFIDELPESWAEVTLEKIAALNPETWGKNNQPDNIHYVDLANTKWGTIESTAPYAWKDAPSRAQRILRPGDTIVGTVRPGNGSFSFVNVDGLTGSTGFAVLRPKKPTYRELL